MKKYIIILTFLLVSCSQTETHIIRDSGFYKVEREELKYVVLRQYIPDDILNSPVRDSFSLHSWWYKDTISCWNDPLVATIFDDYIGWVDVVYHLKDNAIQYGRVTMYMDPDDKRILTINGWIYRRYNPKETHH